MSNKPTGPRVEVISSGPPDRTLGEILRDPPRLKLKPVADPAAPPALPVGPPTPREVAHEHQLVCRREERKHRNPTVPFKHDSACDHAMAAIEADRAAHTRLLGEAVAAARREAIEACRNAVVAVFPDNTRDLEDLDAAHYDGLRDACGAINALHVAAPQPTDPTKGTDHG